VFCVTSLARSQPLESLQKFSSLGRVGNECLHFSRFCFFRFFFSGYSDSCLSLGQFLASLGVACSQSGACGLRQQRAEDNNYATANWQSATATTRESATAYCSVDATCPNYVVAADERASRAACASASAGSFE
jgi:hypothetical protein